MKGRELMQAPLAPLAPRTHTMPFDAADASGWDECLPSVAGCTVETAAGPAEVPDHGDLWRVAWREIRDQGPGNREQRAAADREGSVTLCGECFSLPLRLERTLTLTESAKGFLLSMKYRLTNTGSHPAPWSWAVHPLFAVEPGDRVELPDSIATLRLEGSGGKRLGLGGDTIRWPMAALAGGGTTDLRTVQSAKTEIGDKLFAGPLSAAENWCAIHRPGAGVRIKFGFDPAATPYLGLWICYGGWPDRPGPKQMCVAPEPSTAPVDSLAAPGVWSRVLAPGESFSWPMTGEIELL
ncbi:MAG TPA: hypothetical protein VGS58_09715 [Candidatus Sulfopaludibacter sp.]|nr:hypothetical protein [Candidatus Sulfopaludibacter sp.]